MTALQPGRFGQHLAALASRLPRPRAIIVASAHWLTVDPEVGGASHPATVHDFGGFPQALYHMQYPAPGDPVLAERILALLQHAGLSARLQPRQGLDHGIWVPLQLLYPHADIPVVPLSIQALAGPAQSFAMGRALASLRQEQLLLLGSGSITHNLHDLRSGYSEDHEAPYVRPFIEWIEQALGRNDIDALLDYRRQAPQADRAHPTDEHLLPLYFAMGAAGDGQLGALRMDAGIDLGLLAMDIYQFDGAQSAGMNA